MSGASIDNAKVRSILLTIGVLLQPVRLCWADDQTVEIKKALLQCASPRASDCLREDKLVINILKVYGDYAHATVGHADGSGEIDDAYLKNENGHWKVLDEGAGINAQELGVPKEAW
jgi:hypothetical protein